MKVIKLLKNILSTAYLSISCLRPMFTIRRDGLNAYLLNDECKYIRLLNMSGTWRGIVQSDVRLTWKWACATMPLVKGCLFTATPTYHPSLSPSSPRSMALCNLNFLQIFLFLRDLITDVRGVHRKRIHPMLFDIIQGRKD